MTEPTPTNGWRELNLTCRDWRATEQMAVTRLGPVLNDAEDAGVITAADTIDLLHQWDQQRPSQPVITAYRAESPVPPSSAQARIVRPHTLITIGW